MDNLYNPMEDFNPQGSSDMDFSGQGGMQLYNPMEDSSETFAQAAALQDKIDPPHLKLARSWVGKDYKPGQREQCADFVSSISSEAGYDLKGYANVIELKKAALKKGSVVSNPGDLAPGDLVFLNNTYKTAQGRRISLTPEQQKNLKDYTPIIKDAAQKYNVDEKLLKSVILQESGFNPNAQSKYASGLMQLTPETAAELGVSNPFDPSQSIHGGALYLSKMLRKYKDPKLALAAYNAGPGAVDKYGGVPPYRETQDYVAKVMGNFDGFLGDNMDNTHVGVYAGNGYIIHRPTANAPVSKDPLSSMQFENGIRLTYDGGSPGLSGINLTGQIPRQLSSLQRKKNYAQAQALSRLQLGEDGAKFFANWMDMESQVGTLNRGGPLGMSEEEFLTALTAFNLVHKTKITPQDLSSNPGMQTRVMSEYIKQKLIQHNGSWTDTVMDVKFGKEGVAAAKSGNLSKDQYNYLSKVLQVDPREAKAMGAGEAPSPMWSEEEVTAEREEKKASFFDTMDIMARNLGYGLDFSGTGRNAAKDARKDMLSGVDSMVSESAEFNRDWLAQGLRAFSFGASTLFGEAFDIRPDSSGRMVDNYVEGSYKSKDFLTNNPLTRFAMNLSSGSHSSFIWKMLNVRDLSANLLQGAMLGAFAEIMLPKSFMMGAGASGKLFTQEIGANTVEGAVSGAFSAGTIAQKVFDDPGFVLKNMVAAAAKKNDKSLLLKFLNESDGARAALFWGGWAGLDSLTTKYAEGIMDKKPMNEVVADALSAGFHGTLFGVGIALGLPFAGKVLGATAESMWQVTKEKIIDKNSALQKAHEGLKSKASAFIKEQLDKAPDQGKGVAGIMSEIYNRFKAHTDDTEMQAHATARYEAFKNADAQVHLTEATIGNIERAVTDGVKDQMSKLGKVDSEIQRLSTETQAKTILDNHMNQENRQAQVDEALAKLRAERDPAKVKQHLAVFKELSKSLNEAQNFGTVLLNNNIDVGQAKKDALRLLDLQRQKHGLEFSLKELKNSFDNIPRIKDTLPLYSDIMNQRKLTIQWAEKTMQDPADDVIIPMLTDLQSTSREATGTFKAFYSMLNTHARRYAPGAKWTSKGVEISEFSTLLQTMDKRTLQNTLRTTRSNLKAQLRMEIKSGNTAGVEQIKSSLKALKKFSGRVGETPTAAAAEVLMEAQSAVPINRLTVPEAENWTTLDTTKGFVHGGDTTDDLILHGVIDELEESKMPDTLARINSRNSYMDRIVSERTVDPNAKLPGKVSYKAPVALDRIPQGAKNKTILPFAVVEGAEGINPLVPAPKNSTANSGVFEPLPGRSDILSSATTYAEATPERKAELLSDIIPKLTKADHEYIVAAKQRGTELQSPDVFYNMSDDDIQRFRQIHEYISDLFAALPDAIKYSDGVPVFASTTNAKRIKAVFKVATFYDEQANMIYPVHVKSFPEAENPVFNFKEAYPDVDFNKVKFANEKQFLNKNGAFKTTADMEYLANSVEAPPIPLKTLQNYSKYQAAANLGMVQSWMYDPNAIAAIEAGAAKQAKFEAGIEKSLAGFLKGPKGIPAFNELEQMGKFLREDTGAILQMSVNPAGSFDLPTGLKAGEMSKMVSEALRNDLALTKMIEVLGKDLQANSSDEIEGLMLHHMRDRQSREQHATDLGNKLQKIFTEQIDSFWDKYHPQKKAGWFSKPDPKRAQEFKTDMRRVIEDPKKYEEFKNKYKFTNEEGREAFQPVIDLKAVMAQIEGYKLYSGYNTRMSEKQLRPDFLLHLMTRVDEYRRGGNEGEVRAMFTQRAPDIKTLDQAQEIHDKAWETLVSLDNGRGIFKDKDKDWRKFLYGIGIKKHKGDKWGNEQRWNLLHPGEAYSPSKHAEEMRELTRGMLLGGYVDDPAMLLRQTFLSAIRTDADARLLTALENTKTPGAPMLIHKDIAAQEYYGQNYAGKPYKELSKYPWLKDIEIFSKKQDKMVRASDFYIHPDAWGLLESRFMSGGGFSDNPLIASAQKFMELSRNLVLAGSHIPFYLTTMGQAYITSGLDMSKTLGFYKLGAMAKAEKPGILQDALAHGLTPWRLVNESVEFMKRENPEGAYHYFGLKPESGNKIMDAIGKGLTGAAEKVIGWDQYLQQKALFSHIEDACLGAWMHEAAKIYAEQAPRLINEKGMSEAAVWAQCKQLAADRINPRFGSFPQWMASSNTRRLAQNLLLTPKWTSSIIDNIWGAIDPGGAKRFMHITDPVLRAAQQKSFQQFMATGLLVSFIGKQLMSYSINGHSTFENPPGKEMHIKVGESPQGDVYISDPMFGMFRSVWTMLNPGMRMEDGKMVIDGPNWKKVEQTIYGRLHPVYRTLADIHNGKTAIGEPIFTSGNDLEDLIAYTLYRTTPSDVSGGDFRRFRELRVDAKEIAAGWFGGYMSYYNVPMKYRQKIRASEAQYSAQLKDRVDQVIVAALEQRDPARRDAMIEEAQNIAINGVEVKDKTFAKLMQKYTGSTRYRLTMKQFKYMLKARFDPVGTAIGGVRKQYRPFILQKNQEQDAIDQTDYAPLGYQPPGDEQGMEE